MERVSKLQPGSDVGIASGLDKIGFYMEFHYSGLELGGKGSISIKHVINCFIWFGVASAACDSVMEVVREIGSPIPVVALRGQLSFTFFISLRGLWYPQSVGACYA